MTFLKNIELLLLPPKVIFEVNESVSLQDLPESNSNMLKFCRSDYQDHSNNTSQSRKEAYLFLN